MKKIKNAFIIKTIIIMILLCMIIYGNFFWGGDYYFFRGTDSVRTTFPTYYLIKNYLNKGWTWWSFQMGIGASMLSRFTALTDPFNYILYMGTIKIQKLIIVVVCLRIVFSGVVFNKYLELFEFNNVSRMLASIAYAFSGYTMVMGQNYGFATISVYFPLLLLGIEYGVRRKEKNFLFCISVFLTSIYFNTLFYICCVIIVIYYFVRFFMIYGMQIDLFIKKSLFFLASAILGIGLGGFVTIPITYITGQSPRLVSSFDKNIFSTFDVTVLLTGISRMFSNNALGEGITYIGYANQYMQLCTYTSVLAIVMISAIIVNGSSKIKLYTIVIVIATMFALAWNGFSYILNVCSAVTYRWSFVINFTLAFFIALGVNLVTRNGVKLTPVFFTIYVLFTVYLWSIYIMVQKNITNVHDFYSFIYEHRVAFYLPFCSAGIYMLLIYLYKNNYLVKKVFICLICITMCIEITINYKESISSQLCYGDKQEIKDIEYFDDSMEFINKIRLGDSEFYRINKLFDSLYRQDGLPSDNDAMVQGYYGLKNYSSLNPAGYVSFLQEMGIYVMCPLETVDTEVVKPQDIKSASLNYINGVGDRYDLMAYLGVKYIITDDKIEHIKVPDKFKVVASYDDYNCFLNSDYNPLVFVTYQSITHDEFKDLSVNDKDYLIFFNTVVDEKDSLYKSIDLALNENVNIDKLMETNRSNFSMSYFAEDHIIGNIKVQYDGYLNTTIPYDKGWKIYIDDREVETISLNNGLLGCRIQEGNHKVELKYFPYGMRLGIGVSIISLIVLILWKKYSNRKIIQED